MLIAERIIAGSHVQLWAMAKGPNTPAHRFAVTWSRPGQPRQEETSKEIAVAFGDYCALVRRFADEATRHQVNAEG